MGASAPRKGITVQMYRCSERLAIRLEYDRAEQRQSVFLNSELRSAFYCPVGFEATHVFRGHDAVSAERGHMSEWRVRFAVEQNTFRIRHEICRRDADGNDTKWYWWDRNIEPDEWRKFPKYSEGKQVKVQCVSCGKTLLCPSCSPQETCPGCGADLVCPECSDAIECPSCGETFSCPNCSDERPQLAYAVVRMQEELRAVDAPKLQAVLIDVIGDQFNSVTSWTTIMEQVLNEAGCDVSGVRLRPKGQGEDSD